MTETPNYKQSMNLPQTEFKMKAGLPQNEPLRLKKWEEMDLYHKVLEQNKDGETFILHDGPPYANGPIHIGHALNKILKDFIVRYRSQQGCFAPYVPGWDCHGLPIENKVENKLGPEKMAKIDTPTFRRICRDYATEQVDGQRESFKRLGVLGEWDDPYLTDTPEYEAGNIRIFKDMYLNGSIYRGSKPIHWCTHCHTALAEAEIEYSDETSPSIFVKFYFTEIPKAFAPAIEEAGWGDLPVSVVIWTTTPWTLPANSAVSLAPDAEYVVAKVGDELLVMARDLLDDVMQTAGIEDFELLKTGGEVCSVHGSELVSARYVHPILEGVEGVVIYGDHVTLDTGTGAVHTAPGHGQDDYLVAQNFEGVEMRMPVDDDGVFTEAAGSWAGRDAVGSNEDIISWLDEQGVLLARIDMEHSYPHCWRCKEPVIFRATTQWFVSMEADDLRQKSLQAIEKNVRWVPSWASKRIGGMIAERPDWCISRQRFWGVPIPVFTCASCGATIASEETFDAIIDLFETQGADAWYTTDPHDYLPAGTCCPDCGSTDIVPGTDVLDVWWESGVSHTSVCEARKELRRPADVYLEGSDQHRGWFQSSLLTSMGVYGEPPYKTVVSCGFTVDGEGRKMSKSLGNVIDPLDVIKANGADVLRLWVASVDYSQDMSIDDEIIARSSEAYRRIRNSFRYLLSNLYDFTVDDYVTADEMLDFDTWALARLTDLIEETEANYDNYRFHMVYRGWYDFIVAISSLYFDAIKDRLYSAAPTSIERRSAQTVLANMLDAMVRQLAPILTFTCDEVWEAYPSGLCREDRPEAVHLAGWFGVQDCSPSLSSDQRTKSNEAFEPVLAAREAVTKALEEARDAGKLKKSQEAAIRLKVPSKQVDALRAWDPELLAEIFIVSCVAIEEAAAVEEVEAIVEPAAGEKCPRCWNYRELGEDGLCKRCHDVVEELGFEA
ncbi:MAG: isoleucine--tRNA ligase [Coriobacteriaceae bacterium]|nr:isoleucine--tRNA ligase [Coriobacteriaceae bacterium]